MKNFPGQEQLRKEITHLISNNQFPHASLFYAIEGQSALPLVLETAKSLLVDPENQDATVAQRVEKLIHPDLHFSFPFVGSKETADTYMDSWRKEVLNNPYLSFQDWAITHAGENKQVNINVKELNNIIAKLSLKSFEGRAKIVVVWGAEFMGKEGNRLLKLIEEPPENTYLFLITEKIDRILPTILSRCQTFKMRPVGEDILKNWLMEVHELKGEKLEEAVAWAEGSPKRALEFLRTQDAGHSDLVKRWFIALDGSHYEEFLDLSYEFDKLGRESQKQQLEQAVIMLRNAFNGRSEQRNLPILEILGEAHNVEAFDEVNNIFVDIMEGIQRNGNSKVQMMATSVKLARLLHRIKKRQTLIS